MKILQVGAELFLADGQV